MAGQTTVDYLHSSHSNIGIYSMALAHRAAPEKSDTSLLWLFVLFIIGVFFLKKE